MPKPGQSHAISEDDRRRYNASLARLKRREPGEWTLDKLGIKVNLKKSDLSKILSGRATRSVAKPALDRVLGSATENTPFGRKLLALVSQLDDKRQERLLERAEALLDEQRRAG